MTEQEKSSLNEFTSPGDSAFTADHLKGIHSEPMYSGALSFLRRRFTRALDGVDVVVSGIPFDLATSGRSGTRLGPQAIRRASVNLAWGKHYPSDIDVLQQLAVIDYGDLVFHPGFPHTISQAITDHARHILQHDCSMLTLGGDHYISYPLLKAHAEKWGPLALVQFDAHSDTWTCDTDKAGNFAIDHGAMFYRAVKEGLILPQHSVQIGIRTCNNDTLGINTLDAVWVHEHTADQVAQKVRESVGNRPAYLSFDIDCLDPAFAPGTGTPVCGGLSTAQAQAIMRRLQGIYFIGMDIVEVSPPFDHADISALAGAQIAFDYLALRVI